MNPKWIVFPIIFFILVSIGLLAATRQPDVIPIPSFQIINTPVPTGTKISNECENLPPEKPLITELSQNSGPKGTILEIHGCNLSGFEGDLDVIFERQDGQKITLKDSFDSYITNPRKLIKVVLTEPCQKGETVYGDYSGLPSPCQYRELTPGVYKIYVEPWGNKSNTVNFTLTN